MQAIPVYQVDSFKVVHGANLSDTMSFADELMLDDVYTWKSSDEYFSKRGLTVFFHESIRKIYKSID